MMTEQLVGSVTSLEHRFAALLHPMTPGEFFGRYYERAFAHIRGEAGKLRHVLDLARFRELIARGIPWRGPRPPEIYVDGAHVDPSDFQVDFASMDGYDVRRPIPERITTLLAAGATIVGYGLQDHVPSLDELARSVGAALTAETETHVVYSQGGHQGLTPHYDSTDVFVFHLEGEKTWNLWSQRVTNPIAGLGQRVDFDPASVAMRVHLQPGDVLYIPRGTFHDALATTESLHVSAVAKVPTGFDFLNFLGIRAVEDDEVRRYLATFDRSSGPTPVPLPAAVRALMARLTALATNPATLRDFARFVLLKVRDRDISFPQP